jgi:hypothetical protein
MALALALAWPGPIFIFSPGLLALFLALVHNATGPEAVSVACRPGLFNFRPCSAAIGHWPVAVCSGLAYFRPGMLFRPVTSPEAVSGAWPWP